MDISKDQSLEDVTKRRRLTTLRFALQHWENVESCSVSDVLTTAKAFLHFVDTGEIQSRDEPQAEEDDDATLAKILEAAHAELAGEAHEPGVPLDLGPEPEESGKQAPATMMEAYRSLATENTYQAPKAVEFPTLPGAA